MKILAFLLIFLFVHNVFASTLIFKSTKEVAEQDVETILAEIPTAKYKQIRIAVKFKVNKKAALSRLPNWAGVYAIEDAEEISLQGRGGTGRDDTFTFLIETPPNKIRISARGEGSYKIFVWAD